MHLFCSLWPELPLSECSAQANEHVCTGKGACMLQGCKGACMLLGGWHALFPLLEPSCCSTSPTTLGRNGQNPSHMTILQLLCSSMRCQTIPRNAAQTSAAAAVLNLNHIELEPTTCVYAVASRTIMQQGMFTGARKSRSTCRTGIRLNQTKAGGND